MAVGFPNGKLFFSRMFCPDTSDIVQEFDLKPNKHLWDVECFSGRRGAHTNKAGDFNEMGYVF